MYPIKTVASLTGLGTETIRAWERRYQAILPKRNVNGRRYYSQQDRDRLTLLAHLTREGHNIGKIATLSDAQLQDLLNRSQQKQSLPLHFSEQIIKALSHYQIQHCEQLLKKALIANEPFRYVTDILAPTLKLVEILCHEKKLTVGQEHMFSALVKRILLSMINNLQSYSVNRSGMLLATPSGESHDFGILMCSLLAAEQHFNIYFLGADTPAKDILQAAKELNCEIVLLSLTEYSLEAVTFREMEKIIVGSACENLRIWLVGEGIYGWLEHQEDIPDNLELIDSLETFYSKAMRARA